MIRPLVVTLLVLLAYGGYEAWLSHGGAMKLTADEIASSRAHYEIIVNFAPEAFHVTRMQAIGRLIEVKGQSVFLMDVDAEDARELARNYWIADVKPWQGL